MKRILYVALLSLLLIGCGKSNYQTINAQRAKEMMEEDSVVIVDVRTNEEYNETHIQDAINIPLDELTETKIKKIDELNSKENIILVYCASGKRSKQAAQKLADMGYINIYNFGGLNDWTYGVVDGKKQLAEENLYSVMSAIQAEYMIDILDSESVSLPLEVICDGTSCNYDNRKSISVKIVPTKGTFVLGKDGVFEDATGIIMNGFQCSIKSSVVQCN